MVFRMKVLQEVVALQESVNDEFVLICKLFFSNNSYVKQGEIILEFESSKTNVCVEAEAEGYIEYFCSEGMELKIGEVIAKIYDEAIGLSKNINGNCNDSGNPKKANIETVYSEGALKLIEAEKINKSVFANMDFVSIIDVKETAHKDKISEKEIAASPKALNRDEVDFEMLTPSKKAQIDNLLDKGSITSSVSVYIDMSSNPNKSYSNNYFLSIIIYETYKLLKIYKELNAFYIDNGIAYYKNVNIGLAIDIDNGLKVIKLPNDVGEKSRNEVEKNIYQVIRKYIRKNLTVDDIQGCTFTISDLSNEGAAFFTPLVCTKQSSILGVSGIDEKLMRLTLTLSFDHRVVKGKRACMFLMKLKEKIENTIKVY